MCCVVCVCVWGGSIFYGVPEGVIGGQIDGTASIGSAIRLMSPYTCCRPNRPFSRRHRRAKPALNAIKAKQDRTIGSQAPDQHAARELRLTLRLGFGNRRSWRKMLSTPMSEFSSEWYTIISGSAGCSQIVARNRHLLRGPVSIQRGRRRAVPHPWQQSLGVQQSPPDLTPCP